MTDIGRSGSNILNYKRTTTLTTLYDRPQQPPPPPGNPNWLTGLLYPIKFVAGGARKILSSIWNPNTWDYSEDESDSGTEDESGDDDAVDQATESDAGSPIDVAESYMRAHPPGASPIRHDNSLTPSQLATVLFKERTPHSGGGTSFSPAKRHRDYLLAGSWNIQEEIRRVRAKNDKFVVVGKDEAINLATPIPVSEIVTLDSDEGVLQAFQGIHSDNKQTTRNSSDRNGLEKEDNQENNKKVNDLVENNCYLMTESADIPPVILTQESTNNNDHSLATKIDDPSENRAVTRAGVKDMPQFGVVLLRNQKVLVVILLRVSTVKDKAGVDKAPIVVKDKADVVKDKPTNVVKDKADVVKASIAKEKGNADVVKDKPTNLVKDKADVVKAPVAKDNDKDDVAAVAKDKDKADVVKAPVAKDKEKADVMKVPVAKDKDKDKASANVFVNDKAPTDVALRRSRAQVDQDSQIKMIQVKEMMQDKDLNNLKSKDEGSRSRSQSMNEQRHYKKAKTRLKKAKLKRHIFNIGKDKVKSRQLPTRILLVWLILSLDSLLSWDNILLQEVNVHARKMLELAKEFDKLDPREKLFIIVEASNNKEQRERN
ncbi:hypothetical protein Tco_1409905 [Tanacetum coccineum]